MLRTTLRVRGATRILAPGTRTMSSFPALPLTPPSPQEEAAQFEARIADELRFDDDLWIIEIDDRAGRHLLDLAE